MNPTMLCRTACTMLAMIAMLAPVHAAERLGKIESGKPRYLKKGHEAWAAKGRVVGIAKDAPAFTVTILNTAKKQVAKADAEELKGGKKAYEIWLQPGTYVMLVQAKGFGAYDLHNLVVKKGHDLRIDLEFTAAD